MFTAQAVSPHVTLPAPSLPLPTLSFPFALSPLSLQSLSPFVVAPSVISTADPPFSSAPALSVMVAVPSLCAPRRLLVSL